MSNLDFPKTAYMLTETNRLVLVPAPSSNMADFAWKHGDGDYSRFEGALNLVFDAYAQAQPDPQFFEEDIVAFGVFTGEPTDQVAPYL